MNHKFQYKSADDAELEITSFMSLMIVLVPVLLLSMTFTQITVLDVKLPELTGGPAVSQTEQSQLEIRIADDGFKVFYPENVLVKEIPLAETEEGVAYDYVQLSQVIQEVKRQLPEKRDVLVLSEPNIDYQNLVFTMDAVKSYKTVVATSVVEIELFPEISLGDSKKK
ncbi:ExbD/TolR family protein [Cellvibrio sp. ARAG 10.3]|uniref:ExbD/TolR family protein n=1 Tax=Cellvibrio sp. ARAG 10.3 TaxID=3451358 RepID=UPI003F486595